MTREETAKFLDEMAALYPNVIRENSDAKLMVDLWDETLKSFTYEDVHNALIKYFQNDTRGFVPTAGQLLANGKQYMSDEEERELWDSLLL